MSKQDLDRITWTTFFIILRLFSEFKGKNVKVIYVCGCRSMWCVIGGCMHPILSKRATTCVKKTIIYAKKKHGGVCEICAGDLHISKHNFEIVSILAM